MANKINAKLILELKASGLSRNQIAATRHMSKHSVSDVINIAKEKEITFEKVKHLSEEEIYCLIFPDKFAIENLYEQPDYEYVHQELKRVGVTLKLLWKEYQDKCKTSGSIPMGYTKYCKGYADYTIVNKLTNHLENKPGVKAEVDWSGPTMSYIDTSTGEVITVYLFVGTLPYSQYSYVEPTLDMKMDSFIRAHIHMYEFFDGVPTSATAIIAKLRNEIFYSFPDLKAAVSKKLYEFNHENFQKREGSRYEAYLDEKEFLHPLPVIPYEIATWVYGRTVNLDYHVVFEYNRYSCPYQYAKKKVDLRVTDTKVEIYSGSDRIATHNRFAAGRKNQYSTHAEDMPEKFKFTPWNEDRIQKWASSIGKYTGEVVERIFEAVTIKEQGFNPALAVLRLSNKYSEARLEAACEFAITSGIRKPRYHHLNSILAANQDQTYLESKKTKKKTGSPMGYLRGSSYYAGGGIND